MGPDKKMQPNEFFAGHSAGVKHLDWTEDSIHLRSNSADYEVLYWQVQEGEEGGVPEGGQVTDGDDIDALDGGSHLKGAHFSRERF